MHDFDGAKLLPVNDQWLVIASVHRARLVAPAGLSHESMMGFRK